MMEQIEMKQMLEHLMIEMKVQIGGLASKMEANQEKMDAKMDKLTDGQEELSMSKTDTTLMTAEMKAEINAWVGEMKALRGVTHACLEEEEKPAPEKTEIVAKPHEVPEGATEQDTIGVTEDRSRDLHLAAGCRGRLKTWTKHDGPLRQECATDG
jgi:peptidoglycan hydrolase CwlO-like protein